MRCTRAVPQLQQYIDHQLTLEQTRVLETHIAFCPACRTELALLEEVSWSLRSLKMVSEPVDMHEQIMQRVALSAVRKQQIQREKAKRLTRYSRYRPSLAELLAAAMLATVATFAILLQQPSLHALLPNASSHGFLAYLYTQAVHLLSGIDTNMLILFIWIVGTILGIGITLAVAGTEMRTHWLKAMMERLPVR